MAKNARTIRAEMAKIVSAQTKVRDRVHIVSVWALDHYKAHGDTTLMSDWVNMLKQSGVYRQALLDWFKKHARVEAKKGNSDGLILTKVKDSDHTKIDVAKAEAEPFWLKDTDANANLPKLNLLKMLESGLKKREQAHENPDDFEIVSDLSDEDARLIAGIVQRNAQKSATGNTMRPAGNWDDA